jgi:replicative DNA helicase
LAAKNDGHLSGVSTGLTSLNNLLGGLQKSDLVILAGRPAMGKTALATNIAFHAASTTRTGEEPVPVAFFSCEMSAEQLGTRILAERSEIDSEAIRRGNLSSAEFMGLVEASDQIAKAPFYIDDTPALSVSQLASRARRLKRTTGLGLIVIDYLQLLQAQLGSRPENRVQEISNISRSLKAIAKELDVPVLALSQLSRAVEQREDKHPNLADLRESGSIEQDADVVMFVYREEYYLNKSEPVQKETETEEKFNLRYQLWQERLEKSNGTAEIIVAKQRHGPVGIANVSFEGRLTKFSDLASPDSLPDNF